MAYDASVLKLDTSESAAPETELLDSAERGHVSPPALVCNLRPTKAGVLATAIWFGFAVIATAIGAHLRPAKPRGLTTHLDMDGAYVSTEMLLASDDLRGAVTDALLNANADGKDPRQRQAVREMVDGGFQEFTARERILSLRSGKLAPSTYLTQAQKNSLVAQAKSLAAGSLTLWGRGGDRGIYRFASKEADRFRAGSVGDPRREQQVDDDSASEVVLSVSSLPARKIRFTVGPALGSTGMFLVDGNMMVTDQGTDRISGTIKVGFINLHSTLHGLWWAHGNSSDLGKNKLHVRLSGMAPSEKYPDETWTWSPVVTTLSHFHAEDDDASVESVEVDDHATCSDPGENCSSTRCCNDMSLTCYYKDANWSGCRQSCQFDQPAPGESQAQGVWWCQDLTSHRKNTQLLLKRRFVTGMRVRAYFEGEWYKGTIVLEPKTGDCDKRRRPLECHRRLEWKIHCEGNATMQYFFTNRMQALQQ